MTKPVPGADSDPIEDWMAEALARVASEQDAFIGELAARNPEHAGELRARWEYLRAAGLTSSSASAGLGVPERLGDFRLIERLGGGGMGVVYRAEQLSLRREVALKLVRPEHLFFPGARERFRREVEAVGRLKHAGIVPVYTVGEEQGLPFFAMEKIEGATLAEVLTELAGRAPESLEAADAACSLANAARVPLASVDANAFEGTYLELALRIGAEVAEALAHAHGRGIIHRDVKPSNVALTLAGRAMLLDFGLTSSGEDDRITRTGSQVGTLLYMSPEQVRGDGVDARTDVYSLAVVLYELATLRAPFQGENRVLIEKRILDGRHPGLRALSRRAPRDFEVVLQKAMQSDRALRYAGAADFARDLRNVLEKRPIEARPPGPLSRAVRFVQRNPAGSAALGLGFLLVVGTPTGLLLQQQRHARELQSQLDKEIELRAEADREKERAQSSLKNQEQIASFLTSLFEQSDPDVSRGVELTARDILERGVARIRGELADQPDTRASLLASLAVVHNQLGLYAAAIPLFEESVSSMRRLHERDPRELASVIGNQAYAELQLGRLEIAERHYREALDIQLAAGGPNDWRTGVRKVDLAGMLIDNRRTEEADALLAEALPLLEPAARAQPEYYGLCLFRMGSSDLAKVQSGIVSDYEIVLARCVQRLRDAYAHLEPFGDRRGLILAGAANGLGLALKKAGDLDEAEIYYRKALAHFRATFGEESDRTATLYLNLGGLLEARSEYVAAIAPTRRALEIFSELLPADHPALVLARGNLAGTLHRAGRLEEALEAYGEVIELQRQVHGDRSLFLASSLWNVALDRQALGRDEPIEEPLREAIEITLSVRGEDSDDLLRQRADLAVHLGTRGRFEEARAELLAARAALERVPKLRQREALLAAREGRVAFEAGDLALAEQRLTTAIECALATDDAARSDALGLLGRVFARQGRSAEAESALREAYRGHGTWIDPSQRLCPPCALALAELLELDGRRDEARDLLDLLAQPYADAPAVTDTER